MITTTGKRIIELRQSGLSLNAIKEEIGCSKSTVSKWCAMVRNNEEMVQQLVRDRYDPVHRKRMQDKELELLRIQPDDPCARSKHNMEVRESRKRFLASPVGGKCQVCGYNRCLRALVFHHIDPLTKRFGINGTRLAARKLETLIEEAEKCALLCHNCHSEIHDGLVDVPDQLISFDGIEIPESTIVWSLSIPPV